MITFTFIIYKFKYHAIIKKILYRVEVLQLILQKRTEYKTGMVRATWAKSCSWVTFAESLSVHRMHPFETLPFLHRLTVDIFQTPSPIFLVHHPVSYCHFPMDLKPAPPY